MKRNQKKRTKEGPRGTRRKRRGQKKKEKRGGCIRKRGKKRSLFDGGLGQKTTRGKVTPIANENRQKPGRIRKRGSGGIRTNRVLIKSQTRRKRCGGACGGGGLEASKKKKSAIRHYENARFKGDPEEKFLWEKRNSPIAPDCPRKKTMTYPKKRKTGK